MAETIVSLQACTFVASTALRKNPHLATKPGFVAGFCNESWPTKLRPRDARIDGGEKAAGESSTTSQALTGLAAPGRSVCAPGPLPRYE
jgi:hypothetical protein